MSPFPEITHRKKRAFLAAFAQLGHISKASEAAGIDRKNHSLWIKADPEYAAAFARAEEMAIERLEAEADRRGVEGVAKPVYQGGKLVGHVTEYSDTLLIFRLKALRPERYRDRVQLTADVTTHDGDSDLDAEIARLMDKLTQREKGSK